MRGSRALEGAGLFWRQRRAATRAKLRPGDDDSLTGCGQNIAMGCLAGCNYSRAAASCAPYMANPCTPMTKFSGMILSDAFAARLLAHAAALRSGQMADRDMADVVDAVCELSDVAMRYFFQQPARDFGLGVTLRAVVDMSVSSASKTVHFGLRRVIPKLDAEQRIKLGIFLEQSIHDLASAAH